jgi:hypothetical protein
MRGTAVAAAVIHWTGRIGEAAGFLRRAGPFVQGVLAREVTP